jgi:hypothetical protein
MLYENSDPFILLNRVVIWTSHAGDT